MFLMLSALGATALAAAMAAIPILVHLLHRQKVTPIAWGAMQFLLETPLKVRRRRKIDNWLIMLVRVGVGEALLLSAEKNCAFPSGPVDCAKGTRVVRAWACSRAGGP